MLWEKCLLTMFGLMLVMAALRLGGPRLGGMLAGLPTITAPTLIWTALEHGSAFAVQTAIGSVASCAAGAAFALAYARASRSFAAAGALACGGAAVAMTAVPVLHASQDLTAAVVLAIGVTTATWRVFPGVAGTLPVVALPVTKADPPILAQTSLPGGITASSLRMALVAALLTMAVSTIGPWFGPLATGLLASLPLISAPLAAAEQARKGHEASTRFLQGYVQGLFGKAAFGVVFAWLTPQLGAWPALGAALLVAALMTLHSAPAPRTTAA